MWNSPKLKIQHPDWLKVSNPQQSIDLYQRGILPEAIAGWMIVTALKHPLRAVYGSDFEAAIGLLKEATWGKARDEIYYRWWKWLHPDEVEEIEKEIKSEGLNMQPTKMKVGVTVNDATHVKIDGHFERIKSKIGFDADGQLVKPLRGGFSVITESGRKVTMWEAEMYGKEE